MDDRLNTIRTETGRGGEGTPAIEVPKKGATKMRKLLLIATLAGLAAGTAQAADPFVDWSTMYQYEPGWANGISNASAVASAYGVINDWNGPFAALPFAGHEYTIVFSGLTSGGTAATCGGPLCTFHTAYTGGSFAIYDDVGPATPASWCSFGSFTDGTVLLSGTFNSFFINGSNFSTVGNFEGDFTFTGGTLVGLVTNPGTGLFTGGTDRRSSLLPTGCTFSYAQLIDGKGDLNPPVPTEPSSWSNLKALYR